MPDPDLVAYLDGEADAAAAARIERLLREDPDERRAALALLRQQALLTRLLPTAAPAPRAPRWGWWLAGSAVAAAAGLVVALALWPAPTGTGAKPVDVAAAQASPAPGEVLNGDGSERTLPDGTRIVLAAAGALRVAPPGEPWELLRGSLRLTVPDGLPQAAVGIATAEAVCLPRSGACTLARDDDGTVVQADAKPVQLRDRLTGRTLDVAAGSSAWIPADAAAPREEAEAAGLVRGTVESVAGDGSRLRLRTRFGLRELVPRWIGTGRQGGPERAIAERLRALRPGDRVAIDYQWQEHLRVLRIRLIGQAAPEAEVPRQRDF